MKRKKNKEEEEKEEDEGRRGRKRWKRSRGGRGRGGDVWEQVTSAQAVGMGVVIGEDNCTKKEEESRRTSKALAQVNRK